MTIEEFEEVDILPLETIYRYGMYAAQPTHTRGNVKHCAQDGTNCPMYEAWDREKDLARIAKLEADWNEELARRLTNLNEKGKNHDNRIAGGSGRKRKAKQAAQAPRGG